MYYAASSCSMLLPLHPLTADLALPSCPDRNLSSFRTSACTPPNSMESYNALLLQNHIYSPLIANVHCSCITSPSYLFTALVAVMCFDLPGNTPTAFTAVGFPVPPCWFCSFLFPDADRAYHDTFRDDRTAYNASVFHVLPPKLSAFKCPIRPVYLLLLLPTGNTFHHLKANKNK